LNLSLNGEWALRGRSPEGETLSLTAQVPGNVELDLFRAGIEPDPYYGANEYLYKPYEYWDWTFEKTIFVPEAFAARPARLCFEGLNCIADVFVNGEKIGHSENALIPHVFPCGSALRPGSENVVRVEIHSALLHAAQQDFPVHAYGGERSDEYVRLRMPPHSFGWDITPRFPSAGMWRGVTLESVPKTELTQTYYVTRSVNERRAEVLFKYRFRTEETNFRGMRVRIYLDGQMVADDPVRFVSGEGSFAVSNPRLWWPRGYGEANLYEVRMELLKDGEVVSSRSERIGLRTVDIRHKMAPGDEGEFLIAVNGCPILAKGSNWVPMDAFHSRDAERYDRAVELFAEAGCNIMRLWGGNVYEDHRLFDLCDENGIMVWHDFCMACALYPQSPDFLQLMYEEASVIIRRLRNHASIILWAGDNEVDAAYTWHGISPAENRYNAVTREALPCAVRENDPHRLFLPSSPYIDGGVAPHLVPEQHNWGPRAYFKDDFYKQNPAHFVSECGYHGCPAPESLKKFIPEAELWPMRRDGAWAAHNSDYLLEGFRRGYDRNELMANQVRILFGSVPDTLDEFALLSQITQAEAFKFFIENTRIRKWRRTGIIWWNMIDCWPQISDAIVDWYYTKKLAFDVIARIQAPVCVMLDELEAWSHRVVLGNDSREGGTVQYRLIDADTNEVLLEGERESPANENIELGEIRVFAGQQRMILIEWTYGGKRYTNHYMTGFPSFRAEDARRWYARLKEWSK